MIGDHRAAATCALITQACLDIHGYTFYFDNIRSANLFTISVFRLFSPWASNLVPPGASNYLNPPSECTNGYPYHHIGCKTRMMNSNSRRPSAFFLVLPYIILHSKNLLRLRKMWYPVSSLVFDCTIIVTRLQ
ncbi:hypothetical protein TNCV_2255761 [Trichonephila clavipes]|nr:hypothetical protein TNCV_2255761 [Trichonephila clavipes]